MNEAKTLDDMLRLMEERKHLVDWRDLGRLVYAAQEAELWWPTSSGQKMLSDALTPVLASLGIHWGSEDEPPGD